MTFVDSPIMVYNFQVEEFHTYFVSELGVWVHNAANYETFVLQVLLNMISLKTGIYRIIIPQSATLTAPFSRGQ